MQKSLIYYRRKNWDTAESLAAEAWSVGKLKRAKKRIASIKRAREREANKPVVKPLLSPDAKRPARTLEAAKATKAAKAAKASRSKAKAEESKEE